MTNHRARALAALDQIGGDYDRTDRDMARAGEATAHAMLYMGDQIRALVQQQRLGNVLAAAGSVPVLLTGADLNRTVVYLRAMVGGIVDDYLAQAADASAADDPQFFDEGEARCAPPE